MTCFHPFLPSPSILSLLHTHWSSLQVFVVCLPAEVIQSFIFDTLNSWHPCASQARVAVFIQLVTTGKGDTKKNPTELFEFLTYFLCPSGVTAAMSSLADKFQLSLPGWELVYWSIFVPNLLFGLINTSFELHYNECFFLFLFSSSSLTGIRSSSWSECFLILFRSLLLLSFTVIIPIHILHYQHCLCFYFPQDINWHNETCGEGKQSKSNENFRVLSKRMKSFPFD